MNAISKVDIGRGEQPVPLDACWRGVMKFILFRWCQFSTDPWKATSERNLQLISTIFRKIKCNNYSNFRNMLHDNLSAE